MSDGVTLKHLATVQARFRLDREREAEGLPPLDQELDRLRLRRVDDCFDRKGEINEMVFLAEVTATGADPLALAIGLEAVGRTTVRAVWRPRRLRHAPAIDAAVEDESARIMLVVAARRAKEQAESIGGLTLIRTFVAGSDFKASSDAHVFCRSLDLMVGPSCFPSPIGLKRGGLSRWTRADLAGHAMGHAVPKWRLLQAEDIAELDGVLFDGRDEPAFVYLRPGVVS